MIKISIGISIIAVAIIIGNLILIDYHHLTSSGNVSKYFGIIAMILIIISMMMKLIQKKKQAS